jgi:CheY-like chemotaxis protein
MRILIAEDDLEIVTLYEKALARRKHDVIVTSNGEDCIENYKNAINDKTFGNYLPERSPPKVAATNIESSASSDDQGAFGGVNEGTPYDVVILDYSMPGMNGMDVAKVILGINPHQRIIFASAYVRETLENSVKELNQIVELMQKPFALRELVNTVEDTEVYKELGDLNVDVARIRAANPTHEQILYLLERLKRIQKNRTF